MIDIGPEEDFESASKPSEWRVYSVREITREIKRSLDEGFAPLAVEGEISNFKRHTSGHLYFSLKDAEAQIACVLWRGRAGGLAFQPKDGDHVLAFGTLTVYERQGKYQLDTLWLRPLGVGALQAAFEALKRRLSAEGLFDADRKRPIPEFPRRIGIVTSESGAALRDMLSVIGRRAPWVEVVLRPSAVQGEGAAEDVAAAIRDLNALGGIDVLIVGRGGGSLEDLWAFNEEAVARAVAGSAVPVVSAVGHETDFSICDFAADLRAPTPSAAAELVVKDRRELEERIRVLAGRVSRLVSDGIRLRAERVSNLRSRWGLRVPGERIRELRQRLDDSARSLETASADAIRRRRSKLETAAGRLTALDPEAVLRRGYSITSRLKDGRIVTSASELEPAEAVRIRLSKGAVLGRVESLET